MVKWLYKKILRKFGLTDEQLAELSERLTPANICAGPFLKEGKMCPNTTALSLKLGRNFSDVTVIRSLFKQYDINGFELAIFYLLFDIPGMISQKLFSKSLQGLRNAAAELKGSNKLA